MLYTKSLLLDHVVEAIFGRLLAGEIEYLHTLARIIYEVPSHEQRKVINAILRSIPNKISSVHDDQLAISGIGALLRCLVDDKANLQDILIEWLTSASGGAVSTDVSTSRIVLAALSSHAGQYVTCLRSDGSNLRIVLLKEILQKGLEHFGDKLYMKHTPVLHQEG